MYPTEARLLVSRSKTTSRSKQENEPKLLLKNKTETLTIQDTSSVKQAQNLTGQLSIAGPVCDVISLSDFFIPLKTRIRRLNVF